MTRSYAELRADYAAIHGPTVGDRLRLGDTRLVIRIEHDAQRRGDEFLAGFGKTARDGLLLKAAAGQWGTSGSNGGHAVLVAKGQRAPSHSQVPMPWVRNSG